jgi:hypothetical protein
MNTANHVLIFASPINERDGLEETISKIHRLAEEAILSKSELVCQVYAVKKPYIPSNPSQIEKTEEMHIRDRMIHNPSHVCEP